MGATTLTMMTHSITLKNLAISMTFCKMFFVLSGTIKTLMLSAVEPG